MPEIYKPIFIIGAPRSGTTLLYDIMATHKDLAWFSQHDIRNNLADEFIEFLNLRRRIFKIRNWPYAKDGFESRFRTNFDTPFEASYLWNRWITNIWATSSDVSDISMKYIQQTVINLLNAKNKKRFLTKDPIFSVRIDLLNKIFPDALFIYIIRDGRAVVASMIHWLRKNNDLDGYFGVPLKNNNQFELNLVERHAKQWIELNEEIHREIDLIGHKRFFEVKYENLIDSPQIVASNIFKFCELENYNVLQNELKRVEDDNLEVISSNLDNRNLLWQNRLNSEEISKLDDYMRKSLERFEYT